MATMRSPEQQYALAKSLPIPELAKVLQGKSDVVDMWVAESALRQKMQMQKAEQGMQAMPMAQSPKVVQKDLAQVQQMMPPQATPQRAVPQPQMEQGVAGLPGDVEMPEYAGGGIVAFDDGGEVQHYAGEGPSFVQSASTPFGRGYETFAQSVGRAFHTSPEERLRRNLKNQLSIQGGVLGSFMPQTDEAQANARALYNQIDTMNIDQLVALDAQMKQNRGAPAAVTAQTQAVGPDIRRAEAALDKQAQDIRQGRGPHDLSLAETEITKVLNAEKAPDKSKEEQAGLASLTDSIINKYIPGRRAMTLNQAIGQQNYLDQAFGVDPEVYQRAREDLKKEQEGDVAAKREAGWMRALEAGLGIMGGESPYALTNIGKGSQAAAKGAMEDIKEFKKLERDRRKELVNLDLAENAFKKTGSDAARAAMQHSQDAVDRISGKQADVASHIEVAKLQASGIAGYRQQALDVEKRKGALELAVSSMKNTSLLPDTPEYNREVMKRAALFMRALTEGSFGSAGTEARAGWGKPQVVRQ